MPTVAAIAFKAKKNAPMQLLNTSQVTCAKGVVGDVYGRPGKRQVTLLSKQQWQTVCEQMQLPLVWTVRRANILIDEIIFSAEDVGKQVQIGQLILEITGETDPCNKMELAYSGLRQALEPDWRGGVTCRVIQDGEIHIGDKLLFSNPS